MVSRYLVSPIQSKVPYPEYLDPSIPFATVNLMTVEMPTKLLGHGKFFLDDINQSMTGMFEYYQQKCYLFSTSNVYVDKTINISYCFWTEAVAWPSIYLTPTIIWWCKVFSDLDLFWNK